MKYIAILVIIVSVLIVMKDAGILNSSGPSAKKVEPVLRSFLYDRQYSDCPGNVTLTRLSDIRVGRFYREAGGWPVFASYDLTCRGRSGTSKYSWRNGPGQNTPIAFARKDTSGGLELFTWGSSQDMREKIQKDMRSALK
jgi:hypothetical protein